MNPKIEELQRLLNQAWAVAYRYRKDARTDEETAAMAEIDVAINSVECKVSDFRKEYNV